MEEKLFTDEVYENRDYTGKIIKNHEYEECEFNNCNFTKGNMAKTHFIDCHFTNCIFSETNLQYTGLKTVHFSGCKILGIDFSVCDDFLFTVGFQNCQLDYSSFFKKKMKQTKFIDCSLKEVDFVETDLTMAVFKNCDLLNATFVQTNLEKADFTTATGYAFDPELNKIKKAKFSNSGIAGLLLKYDIDIV